MTSRAHPRKISIPAPSVDAEPQSPAVLTPDVARMLLRLEHGRCSLGPISENSPRKHLNLPSGGNSSPSGAAECRSPRGGSGSFFASHGNPKLADTDAHLDDNKRPWTEEEDIALRELVGKLGTKWAAISREMARHGAGRVGKQCRERWNHQLNPGLVKGKWTSEEDAIIFEKHREFGNQWALISAFLPGRTDNLVKNRYHSTMRRFGRAISQQQQHGLVRPPTKPFPPALLASAAELANHHLVDPSSAHSTSTAAITALVAKSPPLDHPEASNVANRHNMLGGTSLQAAPASSASGFTTDDPLTAEVPSNCALLPVPQVSERGESLQQKAMQSANRRPKEFNNAQDGIVVGDRIFATMKWHEHGSPRSAGLRKRQRL